ncbi:anti-sigma factor family protein [Amycolatopsis alkalitolerans]|uniref:Uncharacterized protein n=1 Tax=Amycolatopsis alkalitolerans TaxID=2547244 RepID=A0A5C4M8W3_9PSEU|nr:zf-HC2 domain-containing protein [Amycolatopsis alkalitolerans]TNC27691.1 hypothetical protein FG385_08175 [Amycolatopsis alkalitolerans]
MNCPYTSSVAAHVLGALEPGESVELERHYRTCPQCREELVMLAPLPGLLVRLSPEDTGPQPAKAHRPAPRRARRLHVIAAALALIAVAGAAGYTAGHDTSGTPAAATVSWSRTVSATPTMRATADLTARPWGTQVGLHLANPPSGKQCHLVAFTRDGSQQTIGWWTTGYYTDAYITTSTSVPLTELSRLEVRDATGTALAGITK